MGDTSLKSRPPLPFVISDQTEILESWKKWQKSFRCYAHAVNLNQKSHDVQLSTFKSLIGPHALEIYNTFSILDTTDVETVIRKFDEHFKPKLNVTRERYKLYRMCQKPGQNFDDFLADLTDQVDKCQFDDMKDEILVYKIVGGVEDEEVRKELLAEENIKCDKAVKICRAYKARQLKGDTNLSKRYIKENENDIEMPRITLTPLSKLVGRPSRNHRKSASRNKMSKSAGSAQPVQHGKCTKEESPNKIGVTNGKEQDSEHSDDGRPDDSDWVADGDDCESKPNIKSNTPACFDCATCGKSFTRKRSLTKHIMIHGSQKDFTCYHCGKTFKVKYYLVRHMVKVHSDVMGTTPRVYSCDVCDYKTIVGPNMRRHKFQHTEDRPFSCQLCDYKCIVSHLMKAHMAKHTGEKPFACDVCPKAFTDGGGLRKHMFKHLPEEEMIRSAPVEPGDKNKWPTGMHSCETCGKVFSSKAVLRNHLVVHTGEKPFSCKVCDYKSAHRSSVLVHMNLKHSTDKPYVCNVCGYACKLKASLQCHMNVHSGERPYACTLCDSKFKQNSHLSVHMKTHTGERPYVCDVCGHRWANQSNLRQHMKIHLPRSGDPSEEPIRKRRKKPKSVPPVVNAIPQWSEQVSTINPMDCFPVETPSFHTYPTQGAPRPADGDCRFFEPRQWPNQVSGQNADSIRIVGVMRPDTHNS